MMSLRPIAPADDTAMAAIIRKVMPEFGASGPGYAIMDPEVDAMAETYAAPRHAYFVAELGGRLVGGAGIGPLAGGEPSVCELRKMYLLAEARGHGIGRALLERCLAEARAHGFTTCYLETLERMPEARALYEKNGFAPISGPMGKTGHCGCDRFYVKAL